MEKWEFIIGVDVSRNTLDVYCPQRKEYLKIQNGTEGFRALLKWCKMNEINITNSIVVMEYTGGYEYKLIQFCEARKVLFLRLPGLAIKRSLGITRGKNDRIDAMRIAQYAEEKQKTLTASKPLDHTIIALKELLSFRKRVVRELAGYKATLTERRHIYPDREQDFIIQQLEHKLEENEKSINQIEAALMKIVKTNPSIKTNYELLTSIKGIGMVNALSTIAYTENFSSFDNARSYAVYVGVIPFDYSSGTSIRGRKKVSHLANKELKQDLTQAAKSAMLHDKELKEYADKKLKEKEWGIVLNNIKFKLILRMFAVVKRQTKYVDNYNTAA